MQSVDELIATARKAQAHINNYTQEQVDEMCLSVGWEVYNDVNIDILARMAVEETGYGNYTSKVIKHKRKIGGVLHDIQGVRTVGCIERDEKTGISKYAKPAGVICAILPATNPTATCGGKAIGMLKCRNAVIFKPSSRAKDCTTEVVNMMRRGLERVGAPADLLQVIELPEREATAELMAKADLIVATGSGPLVKAAYSSGTPAFVVGGGNAVVIIAEDADLEDAAKKIHVSKTFDYAASCSSENAAVIIKSVYDKALDAFKKLHTHVCSAAEANTLQEYMFKRNKKGALALNPDVIAKSALLIAENAGLSVSPDTTMIIVESQDPPMTDPWPDEIISPVLVVYKANDMAQAIQTLKILTSRVGSGHSCGIHTFNRTYIERLGMAMHTSRITVRQPMSAANGGHPFNRMPLTATLGYGTWGGNLTTENIYFKHFMNVTWVSEPVEPWSFTDDEMWGAFWKKYPKK